MAPVSAGWAGNQLISRQIRCPLDEIDVGGKNMKLAYFETSIQFNKKSKMATLYVVPGLWQKLYLSIDFWRAFDIILMSVEGLSSDIEKVTCSPN